MNEYVFPIENGDFPAGHVSELRGRSEVPVTKHLPGNSANVTFLGMVSRGPP